MRKAFPEEKQIMIINIIKNNPMSISDILKKSGMKRATFIYYLNQLEAKGLIKKTRIKEGKKGRPTIIEFNKEVWEKKRKEFNENLEKEFKEDYKKIAANPLTKRILQLIKDNPDLDFGDLLNKPEIKNYVLKFQLTNWLHQNKFIKESFKITSEGEKFLKTKTTSP